MASRTSTAVATVRQLEAAPRSPRRTHATVCAAKFCSRYLKINLLIKSTAGTASLMTKMQGSACPPIDHVEPSCAHLHCRHRGGCASSRLDNAVDLPASGAKFTWLWFCEALDAALACYFYSESQPASKMCVQRCSACEDVLLCCRV